MRLLLDADATILLRSLGLLTALLDSDVDVIWTSFVYSHELNHLAGELQPAVDAGRARVESVLARTPEHRTAKDLRREGADKGEREAIAWARGQADRDIVFVSDDKRARQISGKRPPAISGADCVALLVALGVITRDQARDAITIWDDSAKQHGRPRGWRTFDESFGECEARVVKLLG